MLFTLTTEETKIKVEEVTEPSEVNESNVKEEPESISPKLLMLNHAQARLSKFHLKQL